LKVDTSKCVGCGNCVPVCTMGVISVRDKKSYINQDECVECGACERFLINKKEPPALVRIARCILGALKLGYQAPLDACPTGALYQPDIEWPRSVRRSFSDPTVPHESTGIRGRGTDEIKTNDVTGRLESGEVGLVVEYGRPGIGARFKDLEKMSKALAVQNVEFEIDNPVTQLMSDKSTGEIVPDVLDEKVMSAIIELRTSIENVPAVLQEITRVAEDCPTVCSFGIATRCTENGDVAYEQLVKELGFTMSLNGKTNLGLGKRSEEAAQ